MAKKHGPPLGISKAKTFKDIKSSSKDYSGNCTTGYRGGLNDAHHLIPAISLRKALIDYLDGKPLEYKRALAFFTHWDINAGSNLMGLPEFNAYRIAFASMESNNFSTGLARWFERLSTVVSKRMGPKYPIHRPSDWGHLVYEDNVQVDLNDVWADLEVQHENHNPINPPDFGDDLTKLSKKYRRNLQMRRGQTLEAWKNHPKSNPLFRMD